MLWFEIWSEHRRHNYEEIVGDRFLINGPNFFSDRREFFKFLNLGNSWTDCFGYNFPLVVMMLPKNNYIGAKLSDVQFWRLNF